ncbi:ligand-effect modulator 3 family [Gongronella butleri]|nr:ligand-effect modulator 3 family [Gongronella butleri]
MINYSHCAQYPQPVYLAPSLYSYQFGSDVDVSTMEAPAYHVQNASSYIDPTWPNPNNLSIPQCIIDFTVPASMPSPIYLYYRLTNFYQNHRLYVKNYDPNQLLGDPTSGSTFDSNCGPLNKNDKGQYIYPCGLIANSMFNDTASNFTNLAGNQQYILSTTNIAWPTDKQKYGVTRYSIDQIAPPPNWAQRYPNGAYSAQYPPPDLTTMERFMVWMHVAALPDFRKFWARNDHDDLQAGRWRVTIDMSKKKKKKKGGRR